KVVVLPAPLGPSSTMNSPSFTAKESSRTASIAPKRLLTFCKVTSAMASNSRACGRDRRTAARIEQRQAFGAEGESDRIADLRRQIRRQARGHATIGRVDRDDLGGPEIFRAEHPAFDRRAIGKADVLRAHPKHQR